MNVKLEKLPTHLDLPETDGSIVENFQEAPLQNLLTDSLRPLLERLHPDQMFCIGRDSGIYWRITDPPLKGCKSPDWYYVPGVPQRLDGQVRRSYVMWQEKKAPFIIFEFVSGDGSEEHDRTPESGKFWVYEKVLKTPYYGIYASFTGEFEMYHLENGNYELMTPNERGHYPIPELGIETGLWHGAYEGVDTWVRWWDNTGQLLLTGAERAEQEHQRVERLSARLRELGVDPNQV